jgi:hypothetical protein
MRLALANADHDAAPFTHTDRISDSEIDVIVDS